MNGYPNTYDGINKQLNNFSKKKMINLKLIKRQNKKQKYGDLILHTSNLLT